MPPASSARTIWATATNTCRGLCIGYDSGDAVSSLYKPRFDFSSGVLHKVVFDVADDGYADDQKQLQAAYSRD